MVKAIKNNLYKFLIFGITIISFCLIFAGCNLTTTTPSETPSETQEIRLSTPKISQAKVNITKEEYNAIPEKYRPVLYNKTTDAVVSKSNITESFNWETVYYLSPFEEAKINKGEFVLSTSKDVNARGYIFGIYDGQFETDEQGNDVLDYNKFTKITVLDNKNVESDEYWSFDISSFLSQPKTYYFYVQALGIGYKVSDTLKTYYFDSYNSSIYSFNLIKPVEQTSKVEAQDYQVSWNRVENVKGYEVYVNDIKAHDGVLTGTSYDLQDTTVFTKLTQIPNTAFTVKINSVANEYYYLPSDVSNENNQITINNPIYLSVPTNLTFGENGEKVTATWNSVNKATGYELTLVFPSGTTQDNGGDEGTNLTKTITTSQTSYDLTQLVKDVGQYSIKVKAVGDETTTFSSIYSNYVTYTKTEKLTPPKTITTSFSFEQNNILVSWPEFDRAQSYSVYLKVAQKYDEQTQEYIVTYLNYNSYCSTTSCLINLNQIMQDFELYSALNDNGLEILGEFDANEKFIKFKISVCANAYNYYLQSDYIDIEIENDQLQKPQNLKINGGNLVWDKVTRAEKYQLTIINNDLNDNEENKVLIEETADNYYNLDALQEKGNDFTIKVVAVSNLYVNSEAVDKNYIIYIKLESVSNIKATNNETALSLSWNVVDNVTKYYVYLDLNNSVKQTNEVRASGEESTVLLAELTPLTDTITFEINYSDLFVYGGSVKYLSYNIYVICYSSINIYINSDKTSYTFTNIVLDTPDVSEHNRELSWREVNNAESYNVYLDNVKILTTKNTSVDVSSYMNATNTYNFKVEACSSFYINSNMAELSVYYSLGQLDSPTPVIVGSTLTWEAVDNADYYEIFINGNKVEDNFTLTQYDLSVICASVGTYTIGIKALAEGKDSSTICEITYYNGEGETLQISSHNPATYTLEFNNLTFAESYDIYLNNTLVETITATSAQTLSYNYQSKLNSFKVGYNGDAISLTVAATNDAALSKNFSNSIYVYQKNANATEFYYIFNKYYDNYIDSFDEFVYASLYSMVFDIKINVVINYIYSQSNIDALVSAATQEMYKMLATYSADYDYTFVGKNVTLQFINYYSDEKTYSTNYTKTQNSPLWTNYVPSQVRDLGLPVSDSYAISMNVNNSDELVWALQFGARPVFDNSEVSLKVSGYYDRAKAILNSILPANATDYEKALIIAEYILANSWYDYNYSSVPASQKFNSKFHFLEGFFDDGLVVCDGYAKIYSLLCNMEGIKNYVVPGSAGGGHAWNKIYLDIDGSGSQYTANWYLIDLTWCDNAQIDNKSVFTHEYFMLCDNSALLSNRITFSSYYPDATDNFDYYKSNINKLGVYLHSAMYEGDDDQEQLEEFLFNVLYSMATKGETCVDIKVEESLYSYFSSALQKVSQKLYYQYSINVSFDGQNEISYATFLSNDNSNYLIMLMMNQ